MRLRLTRIPILSRYLGSIVGRLTLWYASVFGICFLSVFSIFYLVMSHSIHRWTDQALHEEVAEIRQIYSEQGLQGLHQYLECTQRKEKGRCVARILNAKGQILLDAAVGEYAKVRVKEDLLAEARHSGESAEERRIGGRQSLRVLYSPLADDLYIQIGLPLLEHELWMKRLADSLLKIALVALFLAVSAGTLLARRALAPILTIARTAAGITGDSLGQRVPVPGRGFEVDQLAKAFNGMLERIDTLVQRIREVTDTLAHDLRTPISGIRGLAEVNLRAPRDPGTYRMVLYQIIDQLDGLLNVFDTILDVSEAEVGAMALQQETVRLDAIAEEMAQTFEPVALDKGLRLDRAIAQEVEVAGDRGRLRQVVANLLDNAIKYTERGGWIRIAVANQGRLAVITVSDSGIGIGEKDLPHIFERYYRGDRSRSGHGVGLGLTLLQGIVRAHGGTVQVESAAGKGTTFRVLLPRIAPGPNL